MSEGTRRDGNDAAPIRSLLGAESWFAHRRLFVLIGAALAAWVAIYHETLASLVRRWNSDPNYSHGYLVPFVSAYLAWQAIEAEGPKQVFACQPRRRDGVFAGASLLIAAILLAMGTLVVPSLVGESASMLLSLAGVVLLLGGWSWWRRLWAPIAFLVFLIPWPSELYSRAAFPLQLVVSRIAAALFEILGIPVLRDGNLIHLPGQTMHVAQACSGMRQLTAFLAIAACAALLVQRPLWYRITLLVSSVPIAILVNALRVTATGLVIHFAGAQWAEGSLHTLEGLAMIVVGLGVFWAETRLLDWLLEQPNADSTRMVAEGLA